jgi:hypothetical protein
LLAGFGAVEVLLRPLYLLQNILMRVYLIEIPRDSKFNFRLTLAAMLAGIAIIVIAYILLGPIAISLFFSDAYLSSIPLILPLTLLGAFVVLESLPRSAVLSYRDTSSLPYFVLGHVLIAVTGLIAIIYAANELTLAYCAWIGAVIGLLRVILTFSTYVKTRQERRRAITP